ncbi:MAG: hypothetical protein WCK58_11710, partial [Chloroflexota bacterium]
LAIVMVSYAIGILSITGAWAFSDGLSDAGARLKRPILWLAAAIGPIAMLIAYAPYFGQAIDLGQFVGWLNVIGLSLSLVLVARWSIVAARLVLATSDRLKPQRAWFIAWLAGVLLVVERIGSPVQIIVDPKGENLMLRTLVSASGSAVWIALFVAALIGLGRGTAKLRIKPPLMRLFVVHGSGADAPDGELATPDADADADADADRDLFAWATPEGAGLPAVAADVPSEAAEAAEAPAVAPEGAGLPADQASRPDEGPTAR